MPEPLEDVKEAEKKDSVKPLEPKGSIFLKSSDFREAKILQFQKVCTKSGTNYLLIQAGGKAYKSSIIVLDSKLQMQEVRELDGLKIIQVSQSTYQGHLFATDANQNLIAINIKLVCQGEKPYTVMSYAEQGDSRTLLSVGAENIWLLHA